MVLGNNLSTKDWIDYEKGDNSVLQILSLKTRGATLRWQIRDFWTSGLLISFYINSYRLFRNKEYLLGQRPYDTKTMTYYLFARNLDWGIATNSSAVYYYEVK